MKRQGNGSVVLTQQEMVSLAKLVGIVHDRISTLSSDGDFLGRDTYYALQMWDSKLHGQSDDLTDYISSEEEREEGEEEEEEEDEQRPKTVDEWLNAYGRAKGDRV